MYPITSDVELRELIMPQNEGDLQQKITKVESAERGRVVTGSE